MGDRAMLPTERAARPVLLFALVAVAAALPSNYEQTAQMDVSKDALDRVIEEPDSKEPIAPSVSVVAPKEQQLAQPEFKNDPLATTVVGGRAEDFMNVFQKLDLKTEKIVAEDTATSGMVMPPAIELDEEDKTADTSNPTQDIKIDFKKPSQPISEGFKKLEDSTEDVVDKEAHVSPEGAVQKAAEKAGTKIATKKAKTEAKAEAKKTASTSSSSTKKKAKKSVASASKKEDKTLAKQNNPGAVKVASTGKLSSTKPSGKPNSASAVRGVTYLTVGLTAMTVFIGSL